MNARNGARLAAVPGASYRPTPRLATDGTPQVTFVPEISGGALVFDFSTWPVSAELQLALAQAFAFRTRPGGPIRASGSAGRAFRLLRTFAKHLAASGRPPQRPQDRDPVHLKGWAMARSDHQGLPIEQAALKSCLRALGWRIDGDRTHHIIPTDQAQENARPHKIHFSQETSAQIPESVPVS